jgi:TonB-linked SusC/RagA family outer membrane protein
MKKDHYTHLLCRCAGMLLLMLYAPWVLAQDNVTVTGKVISQENNAGLPGVNVVVKGTTTGTTTNADGNYTIAAPANSTLVFSFIGYINEEVAVGNRSTININLAPDIKSLSEVVVIGYGERERKDLTGSISTVSSAEIEKSVAIQPELALQGRAAGVFVSTPGGNPNARPQVRIRGVGTFNFADPLYVVDGVPITEFGSTNISGVEADLRGNVNILSLINPADIESISVLKDAAAAAVYGVRASNGVVLITTKKGKQGKPRVEVTASRGIQNLRKTYDMLNVQQFTQLYQEAAENANQDPQAVFDPTNANYLGNSPTYDWQTPLINRDALLEDYSAKMSGGSEATTYYVSGGYSKTESPLISNNLKRYSLAINVNSKINKYLSAGITYRLGYIDAVDNTFGDLGYTSRASPWQPIYDPNSYAGYAPSISQKFKANPDYNPLDQNGGDPFTTDGDPTLLWGPQTRSNVFAQQALRHTKYYVLRNLGTSFVQVEPLPGLRFKGTLSIDWFYNRRNDFTDFNAYLFSQTPGNPYNGNDGTAAGSYGERHSRNLNMVKEFSINYGRAFGNHNIDVLLNAMDQEYGFQLISGSSPVPSSDPRTWGIGSPYRRYVGSGTWRERSTLQGYLARVSYNFNDKYYLDATVRRDGSSRFAPGYKWGTFPGFQRPGGSARRTSCKTFPF